jgi:16S rRNA (cytosine967-C5)-methyltransferase
LSHSFRDHHLLQLLETWQGGSLDLHVNTYFRSHKALGSKDRRSIGDDLFGMIRWRGLLDRLGEPTWEGRLVEWRRLDRSRCQNLPEHIQLSFPKDLFNRIKEQHGVEVCRVLNETAPLTVRVNLAKTTRTALLERWRDLPVEPCPEAPTGIRFQKRQNLFHLPEYLEGLFEVQDEASQLAADLIQAQPGDQVLDYCAGAGGKTLAFAHRLVGKGQIYLHDVRSRPLQEARRRLKRAGVENFQILEESSSHSSKLKSKMDWVVVDAPCTGSGTLRRYPEQKWRIDLAEIERLMELQQAIFEKALCFLKEGGKIAYITCSILREENEQQLDLFLKNHPLRLVGEPFQSLPKSGGMDGFFAAVMERQ